MGWIAPNPDGPYTNQVLKLNLDPMACNWTWILLDGLRILFWHQDEIYVAGRGSKNHVNSSEFTQIGWSSSQVSQTSQQSLDHTHPVRVKWPTNVQAKS